MAAVAFDGLQAFPLMPASGGTVNGDSFAVPRGAKVMTIHVPALAGDLSTLKIQSLDLNDKTTWRDITVFDLTDGTFEALDGLPEGTVVTLPITATGGGMLRFVASADQSSAPVRIPVFFYMEK
jgi:hypothetical protein